MIYTTWGSKVKIVAFDGQTGLAQVEYLERRSGATTRRMPVNELRADDGTLEIRRALEALPPTSNSSTP